MSDEELLAAWAGGDRAAGEALVSRHFDSVYGFFARKIDADASELVQRTFLGLTEARDRFRGEASVRTFLFAIARHQLHQFFAAHRKDAQLDFSVSSLRDIAPSPSSFLRRNDDRAILGEAIKGIALDLQIALELHFWEGLRGPEIARVLDIPEGTVRSRLRRGLEALRDEMERLAGEPRAHWQDPDALERWARDMPPLAE